MKAISNILLGISAITGLIMAGAETNNLITQVLASIGGVMLFTAAMLGIARVNKE